MRKRRPSRRGSSARADEQAAAVGVAWYSPAEFVPLRECAADLDIIEDTHAEWEDKAIEVLQVLARKGVMAERIPLIVDEVVRWCAERDRPFDSAARAAYVSEALERRPKGREG
jgi:hypothetical protein